MNPDTLSFIGLICGGLGLGAGLTALIGSVIIKRREKAEAKAQAEYAALAAQTEEKARAARRKLEEDRIASAALRQQQKERALREAYEAELRPVRALIEDTPKKPAPRVHNQRKNPPPAPKNTQSRTVNGRNEMGYYDDSGLWVMLSFNEAIHHSYFDNLRAEQEAARAESPAPEKTEPTPTAEREYSKPEYSAPEYSTPDYSSSSSSDSSSSSSSSYDSGSSSSYDSGSSFSGGDSGSF